MDHAPRAHRFPGPARLPSSRRTPAGHDDSSAASRAGTWLPDAFRGLARHPGAPAGRLRGAIPRAVSSPGDALPVDWRPGYRLAHTSVGPNSKALLISSTVL